jgi:phage baseplate assembly protein W
MSEPILTQSDLSTYNDYKDHFYDDVIYSDFDIRMLPHPVNGDIGINEDLKAIKASLKNLILTKPGEKAFDHKFGSTIAGQIFENFEIDQVSIIESVRRAIMIYEPRVMVNDVQVDYRDYDNTIILTVNFTAKNLKKTSSIEVGIRGTR